MAKEPSINIVDLPYGDVSSDGKQAYSRYTEARSASHNGLPVGLWGPKATPYSYELDVGYDILLEHTYGTSVVVHGQTVLDKLISRSSSSDLLEPQYQLARNRALASGSRRAEAMVGVALAESNQTLDMIFNLFRNLYRWFLDILRSVKTFNFKKLFDVFSEVWLQVRYGWRPLYFEIHAIKDALDESKPGLEIAYGKHVEEFEFESNFYVEKWSRVANIDGTVKGKSITKSGYTYVLEERQLLFDKLGLHFESILTTAWELVPFSFIIDWFIGIGDYLQHLAVDGIVEPHNSYDVHYVELEAQVQVREPNSWFKIQQPPGTYQRRHMIRTIPEKEHVHEFQFSDSLNWAQSLDLILIGQQLVRNFVRH